MDTRPSCRTLRLGPTCPTRPVDPARAGADGHDRVAGVVLAAEQPLLLELGQPGLDRVELSLELGRQLGVLGGRTALDARPGAVAAWNHKVQERMRRTVWNTGGCTSWYLDAKGNTYTRSVGAALNNITYDHIGGSLATGRWGFFDFPAFAPAVATKMRAAIARKGGH